MCSFYMTFATIHKLIRFVLSLFSTPRITKLSQLKQAVISLYMSENKLNILQILITLEEHHLRYKRHETPKHTEAYYTKLFDVSHFFYVYETVSHQKFTFYVLAKFVSVSQTK